MNVTLVSPKKKEVIIAIQEALRCANGNRRVRTINLSTTCGKY